jgi:sigma-B regulation protein RsbU (phosphoserine phosphatase)
VCHEALPDGQMASNLLTVCLGCMTPGERQALERDLEGAARVQRALLPEPCIRQEGWEVAFLWEPKGAVSGDHVDLIRARQVGEPMHLLVGDVAGKGVAASFLQAHLHALFRALAPAGLALPELVARANGLFAEATSATKYATLAVLRLHAGGLAELVNAGHPRPLLADARGVRPVEGGGLPLGMFAEAAYQQRALQLLPGQTLLLYSDGWTEAAKGEEEFGIGRAAATLRAMARAPLPELLAACREAMESFLEGESRSDDLSLVALRRAGG